MLIKKYAAFTFVLLLFATQVSIAQILKPAKWRTDVAKKEVQVGQTVDLVFYADIDKDWYLYSSDFDPNLGPMVTTFNFNENAGYERVGDIKPINPKEKYEDFWGGDYTYFTKKAEFRQTVKILQTGAINITGAYDYQVCTDADGRCIPFDDEFAFTVTGLPAAKKTPDTKTPDAKPAIKPKEKSQPANQTSTPDQSQATPTNKTAADRLYDYVETNFYNPKGNPVDESLPEPIIDPSITTNDARVEEKDKVNFDIDVSKEEIDQQPKSLTADSANQTNITVEAPVQVTEESTFATKTPGPEEETSLWAFFFLAFGSGLVALLTPCVFPMIPMTVTFFTKQSGTRAKGIQKAVVYGLSIVVIYVVIGTAFAAIFGAEAANALSTHWIPNVLFFVVFIVFALSFLGLFEITLPSNLTTKMDREADKGGYYGVFFMAFTLALASFSCTGPIAGSILVGSANGEFIRPVTGMLGFSLAFALPFTLFAIFPAWLSGLPKSGGWLNSVKVVLGFLELALAFKFLSVADLAYHWNLLDRHIYLAIWIAIFSMMALYLIGKIRLPHDSPLEKVGVLRAVLGTFVFAFVIYLIPGMFGAPLKELSGYLPPQYTNDFDLSQGVAAPATADNEQLCSTPKYSDFLHLPYGLKGYFTIEEALSCAKEQNKPVFIDFTGHGCVNCRKMEEYVWADEQVLASLKEDFVIASLYADDKTELPESEWYTSSYDGKLKKTLGKMNADFQISKYGNNAQPYYLVVSPNGELIAGPVAYEPDTQQFLAFLKKGAAGLQ